MEEIDINTSLRQADLFNLFKQQLKKDVESAGIDATFADQLPLDFDPLKQTLVEAITPLVHSNSTLLPGLLYRVDISEQQLGNYQATHKTLPFEEIVAELIIKRELQKVILKKTFSK